MVRRPHRRARAARWACRGPSALTGRAINQLVGAALERLGGLDQLGLERVGQFQGYTSSMKMPEVAWNVRVGFFQIP